mgnify:CR=1 FL=1
MTYAQHDIRSFFDDMGIVRLETQELQESSDTLVNLFHRTDDIVWSRVVYRIIDMRLKQNYQLYTPVSAEDPVYSSLFRTMLRAIEKHLRISVILFRLIFLHFLFYSLLIFLLYS